jgi:hypothetical protein
MSCLLTAQPQAGFLEAHLAPEIMKYPKTLFRNMPVFGLEIRKENQQRL